MSHRYDGGYIHTNYIFLRDRLDRGFWSSRIRHSAIYDWGIGLAIRDYSSPAPVSAIQPLPLPCFLSSPNVFRLVSMMVFMTLLWALIPNHSKRRD